MDEGITALPHKNRKATMATMGRSFVALSLLFWAILVYCCPCNAGGVASDPISVEACRQDGFDPFQLTCSVCQLLPNKRNIVQRCQACCLPYKTLKKQNRRYEYAVLMVPEGAYSEIDTLLEEDLERIHEEKGEDRFIVKKSSSNSGGFMFQLPPAFIFWFDKQPPAGADPTDMEEQAVETMLLDRGWRRDDVRDMILALLPNKK